MSSLNLIFEEEPLDLDETFFMLLKIRKMKMYKYKSKFTPKLRDVEQLEVACEGWKMPHFVEVTSAERREVHKGVFGGQD